MSCNVVLSSAERSMLLVRIVEAWGGWLGLTGGLGRPMKQQCAGLDVTGAPGGSGLNWWTPYAIWGERGQIMR